MSERANPPGVGPCYGPADSDRPCAYCGSLPGEPCKSLTVFMCGPSKCEHDYSAIAEYSSEGGAFTSTAVCVKCGRRAIDEAIWR